MATRVHEEAQKEFTNLNVRNAPADLVRRAKMQSASEGISLRQFVLEAIRTAVEAGNLVEPTQQKASR